MRSAPGLQSPAPRAIRRDPCSPISRCPPGRRVAPSRSWRSAQRERGKIMRVYEAIGETLKRLEVRATFGLMGDGNLRFMTYVADGLGIPYYAARHEGGAVA